MHLTFLSPLGGLLVFTALLPVAAFLRSDWRSSRVARALGLPTRRRFARASVAVRLSSVPALLALAAAQPVVELTRSRYARSDAEAFFVFDTSRSMLASSRHGAPTRFDRARTAGTRIRELLGDVPAGVASLTDYTVPHLFPTVERGVFRATVERALGIEKPPPAESLSLRVSTLGALSDIVTGNFFSPAAKRRLLVVLTDAETRPFTRVTVGRLFTRAPGIQTVFVSFGNPQEQVFRRNGRPEAAYRPDPRAAETAAALAAVTRGRAFDEDEVASAAQAARAVLGGGKKVPRGTERRVTALGPFAAMGVLLPLAFLFRRRL